MYHAPMMRFNRWNNDAVSFLEYRKSPYEGQTTLKGMGASSFLCSATVSTGDYDAVSSPRVGQSTALPTSQVVGWNLPARGVIAQPPKRPKDNFHRMNSHSIA